MRAQRGGWDAERETGRGRGTGGWLLLAGWLCLLLPALCFAAWLALPPAWRATLGLPQPGATGAATVVVTLPALPGHGSAPQPAASPTPTAGPPAWQQWRSPAPPAGERPLIAVVLTGLGRSSQVTAQAIQLPGPLGLALSPYGRPFGAILAEARAAGHELLIELPMKGDKGDGLDLGPQALLPLLDASQNLKRLAWLLDGAAGQPGDEPLIGALVLGGGGFLRAEDVALPVLAELARRGLLLVSGGDAEPLERLAAAAGLVLLRADQVAADAAGSDAALAAAERVALLRGQSLVLLPADAGTVARLAAWAASLEARGFALAPPTAVLERRLAQ